MRRLARADVPALLDRGLPALTRAADHSKLWVGAAGLLLASTDARARRAALRGIGSIAVASLLANQLGKRLVPRSRPVLTDIPASRVAHRVPVSSSFPSGHSASAAAFAVGAAVELPALALPVGALAAAVAFSRVYTGVHFPTDVLTGAALGAGVAAVGAVAVPARHTEPPRLGGEPARPQPARPTGRGLVAVINPAAGNGAGHAVIEALQAELPDAQIVELGDGDDVATVMHEAARRCEVLGVAGGDGTINAAATAALQADLPLLVIPAGTFNHFAKDIEITDPDDAIDALRTGRAVRIDVGDANGQVFLNTASLGSYPEFVKVREHWEGRLGKPIAAAVAILTVLRRCPPLAAEVDGVPRRLVMLFVGNGDYRPRGFVPRWRRRLDAGHLDMRLVDAARPHSWLQLVAATVTGDFYRSSRYVERRRPSANVRITGQSGYLARDGEVAEAPEQVCFSVRPAALTVYRGRRNGLS